MAADILVRRAAYIRQRIRTRCKVSYHVFMIVVSSFFSVLEKTVSACSNGEQLQQHDAE